jgi:hypothetical protein
VTSLRTTLSRVAVAACAVVLLSSCRVDQTVSLKVNPNGSGSVTVIVTADKNVVAKAPSLAQDIRTDDLEKAGWKVEGPTKTKTGGLSIELTHSFSTPEAATAILAQVSESRGPLHDMLVTRTGKDTNSTWTLAGKLEVTGGLNSFIDDGALDLLGVSPYAAEVSDAGLDLGDAVSVTFTAQLPGSIDATTGLQDNGTITWRIPMDSTHVAVGSSISRVARTLLLALLVLWIAGTAILLLLVFNARNRRQRTPRL